MFARNLTQIMTSSIFRDRWRELCDVNNYCNRHSVSVLDINFEANQYLFTNLEHKSSIIYKMTFGLGLGLIKCCDNSYSA